MSGYTLRAVPLTFHGCLGDADSHGAEEVAPDGSTRTLCECAHLLEEDAIACATPRSTPALARLAFEAYNTSTGGKTFDGRDVPPYDVIAERTPHVARAWEAAADAVRKAVRP